MTKTSDLRRFAAQDGRRYMAGEMSWDEFMDRYGESRDDSDVGALVDLIEHEPQRGGFLGVSESAWLAHRRQVETILRELESPH